MNPALSRPPQLLPSAVRTTMSFVDTVERKLKAMGGVSKQSLYLPEFLADPNSSVAWEKHARTRGSSTKDEMVLTAVHDGKKHGVDSDIQWTSGLVTIDRLYAPNPTMDDPVKMSTDVTMMNGSCKTAEFLANVFGAAYCEGAFNTGLFYQKGKNRKYDELVEKGDKEGVMALVRGKCENKPGMVPINGNTDKIKAIFRHYGRKFDNEGTPMDKDTSDFCDGAAARDPGGVFRKLFEDTSDTHMFRPLRVARPDGTEVSCKDFMPFMSTIGEGSQVFLTFKIKIVRAGAASPDPYARIELTGLQFVKVVERSVGGSGLGAAVDFSSIASEAAAAAAGEAVPVSFAPSPKKRSAFEAMASEEASVQDGKLKKVRRDGKKMTKK